MKTHHIGWEINLYVGLIMINDIAAEKIIEHLCKTKEQIMQEKWIKFIKNLISKSVNNK